MDILTQIGQDVRGPGNQHLGVVYYWVAIQLNTGPQLNRAYPWVVGRRNFMEWYELQGTVLGTNLYYLIWVSMLMSGYGQIPVPQSESVPDRDWASFGTLTPIPSGFNRQSGLEELT